MDAMLKLLESCKEHVTNGATCFDRIFKAKSKINLAAVDLDKALDLGEVVYPKLLFPFFRLKNIKSKVE